MARRVQAGQVGTFLVIAGALASGAIQGLLIFGNYYADSPGTESEVAAILRIALLVVGALAAMARRPWVVMLAFAVHTWPAGLYMMLLPGLGAAGGLATLAMPIGAVLIYAEQRERREAARDL